MAQTQPHVTPHASPLGQLHVIATSCRASATGLTHAPLTLGTNTKEGSMRLWTAMLGAWLAAGTGAADAAKTSGLARPEAAAQPRPVSECCLRSEERGAEASQRPERTGKA
jgi:hypothetical protein